MKHLLATSALSTLAALIITSPALAGDRAHMSVNKVVEAYGGAKFEKMKSIMIEADLRYGWLGQGQSPEFVDLEPMTKIYHFDLINQRGSEEAWGGQGAYAERVIASEDGQQTINYLEGTYSENTEAGFYDHFGGEIRTLDVLLAYNLMQHRDTAKINGEAYYRGKVHDLVEYDMPGTSLEPVLWVDRETGLISKMRRVAPAYTINYVFDNYKTTRGITYADDFILYIDDVIVEYAKSHSIRPNGVKASVFEVEKGIMPEPETVARDAMRVDHVAGQTYQTGQGFAYSAFVDAGDYLIGIGGYNGLKDRYAAYTAAHGAKPLKYQVMTHHHLDHVEGVGEALELGATIVTLETARDNLNRAAEKTIDEANLQIIEDAKTLLGPIEIHRISTPHAQDYALVYVPGSKTVFQADHYNGNFKDRASSVSHVAMGLKREIDRLELDVDYMLSAHAPKIESYKAFEDMAKKHVPGICPARRKICMD